MYLPAHFEITEPIALHELVSAHPLGLLVTPGADGQPSADPIPLMLDVAAAAGADRQAEVRLVGHVARANPLWRLAQGREVLVVFQAAQGYVSPSWYAAKARHGQVVPTWNYAVVQAQGVLRATDDAHAVLQVVQRLTQVHEGGQAQPWAVDDAPTEYVQAMLQAIVAIEVQVTRLVGKFKLSQNRDAADVAGVLAGLQAQARPGALALAERVAQATGQAWPPR